MSYAIYSEKGYIAPGPSIGGLRDLSNALTSKKINPVMYPQVSRLFQEGVANSPLRLRLECVALSKVVTQPDVKQTLIELGKAAAKAKTIVILHDGMGHSKY